MSGIIGAGAIGIVNRESWQAKGACRKCKTPDDWFPDKEAPPWKTIDARALCVGCPVRDQCLQYAMDNPREQGIWGGLTEKERAGLRSGRPVKAFAKCKECSAEFVKRGGWHRYCSEECRKTNELRRDREYRANRRRQLI
uniref:WhiB family transcriptional regulator n=1 Tax=Mycolicibacterium fortuitum TaxID=1766 RepID=UPI002795B69B|nr:WhiB family transcriptional regulator [Mycolicibacterium fortuitum]